MERKRSLCDTIDSVTLAVLCVAVLLVRCDTNRLTRQFNSIEEWGTHIDREFDARLDALENKPDGSSPPKEGQGA